MIDNDETVYRFINVEDDNIEGDQVLVKMSIVDLDTVTIGQDPDGMLTVTPKPAPAEVARRREDKFRLEPEGDMFRLVATRFVRSGVEAGTKGGLVTYERNLSHYGSCWIFEDSTVHGDVVVRGDAQVHGSTLEGTVEVADSAYLYMSSVTGNSESPVVIGGQSRIIASTIVVKDAAELSLNGVSNIGYSRIHLDGETDLRISGCLVDDACITGPYDLMSIATKWGWLSAYRDKFGQLVFRVGCQRTSNPEGLIEVGRSYGTPGPQLNMLRKFIELAQVAQEQWPASSDTDGEEPATDEVPVNPIGCS